MALFGILRRRSEARGERAEPVLIDRKPPPMAPRKTRKERERDRERDVREAARPRRRSRSPLIFSLLSGLFTLVLWGTVATIGVGTYLFVTLDKQGLFTVPAREPGMMILSADGHLIAERGAFFGDSVRVDELPQYVTQAVIAIEDRRFYKHFGIDPFGLIRAALANWRAGHVVEGGSTLTQQLAKNLFLKPDRTYHRKMQEALLALWLESKYSKDEILQLYLNRVYYGAGAIGIEQASEKYFGRSARDVSLSEAAILAAVLKAPSAYNPINAPEKAQQRAKEVIRDMVEEGFITEDEAAQATAARTTVKPTDYLPATQYIVDWVAEQLPELIGQFKESIVVETTLDRTLQATAEKSVRNRLSKDGRKLRVTQAAVVAMDPNGAVKAMVGGRSYIKSQFNRAVKAKRQPGSAFKAFVYLTAIEQGANPSSVEVDEPVTIGDWSPENYRRKFLGPVPLRKAFALSLNTVAAKVAASAGPENVVKTAHRLGITSELQPNPSIALGTSEVTLLELTTAYTPFANGGVAVVPHVVTRITTRDGKVLYERKAGGMGEVVLSPDLGAMNSMLRDVVTSGTARRARLSNQDVGGKTGTSQDYRDAWFIGFTAHMIAGVWVGNDDNSPTAKVTGGSLPASIWMDIMEPAHRKLEWVALPGDTQWDEENVAYSGGQGGSAVDVFDSMFRRQPPRRGEVDFWGRPIRRDFFGNPIPDNRGNNRGWGNSNGGWGQQQPQRAFRPPRQNGFDGGFDRKLTPEQKRQRQEQRERAKDYSR